MNKKLDMTQGTGWKKVLIFSVPLMIGNILQQLYNTVDGIVVGRFVSQTALAAVGNCGTLTFLLVGIANGLSIGCGIVLSQFFGAGKQDRMKKAATTSFSLSVMIGAALFAVTFFGGRFLLGGLMKIQEADILESAVVYIKIYATGLIFQFVYNTASAMMRSVGDSRASLYFLAVSTVTNLVLDILFVLRFGMGVAGVAIATVISQFISAAFSLVYMMKKYEIFRFGVRDVRYDKEMGSMCLKMGVPSMLQFSVIGLGGVLMQRIVNHFGKVLMAAFVVGNKVENYIFIPIQAFANGMSTFTGQNMGAGRADRVRECWKKIVLCSFLMSAVIEVLVYVFAEPIALIFALEGDSIALAVRMIRFLALTAFLFAVYLPTVNVLSGAGDAYYAMLCSFSTLFMRIVAASIMVFIFDVGPQAVWISVPIGWIFCVTLSWTRYFRGTWEKKSLVRK